MRLGILASHEGTTLQAVLDAVAEGRIRGCVAIVISNNSDSGALRRARASGIPSARLSSATHPHPEQLDRAIVDTLTGAQVDVVLLAGYLKKLGPGVLETYRGRILNTHPALLPKFGGAGMYGLHVHEAVLASGDLETGVTIHLVDADYDTGPVLAQCRVPVVPGESATELASRVQAREREFVVETLAQIAGGTLGAGPVPPGERSC
jgi:phosphoribosylglycinamide formyltransferase-1